MVNAPAAIGARSIDIESGVQTPLVPADAGTQALPQKLGSRIRGNERGVLPREAVTLYLELRNTGLFPHALPLGDFGRDVLRKLLGGGRLGLRADVGDLLAYGR